MTEGAAVPDDDDRAGEAAAPSALVRWTAGCAIAVALAAGAALYYGTEVCEEQLTDAGQVVSVCRSLEATDPPMVGIGLVVLVALTAFFSEISGFGVSLKREVRRNTKKADAAISAARSARQTSEFAQDVALATDGKSIRSAGAQQEIDQLAARYDEIRRLERSSDGRTARLTSVVSKMVAVLSGVTADDFDATAHLSDPGDGKRMAAYAFLYANPDPRFASALVEAILGDRTRFGQYWAIRALRRVIAVAPAALDLNSRRQLEALLRSLPPGTDRAFELRQALAEAQSK